MTRRVARKASQLGKMPLTLPRLKTTIAPDKKPALRFNGNMAIAKMDAELSPAREEFHAGEVLKIASTVSTPETATGWSQSFCLKFVFTWRASPKST